SDESTRGGAGGARGDEAAARGDILAARRISPNSKHRFVNGDRLPSDVDASRPLLAGCCHSNFIQCVISISLYQVTLMQMGVQEPFSG
ncbi:unnamed protein product, partial [Urochloa humidicola]